MLDVLMRILNEIDAFVYVSDMETNQILFVNQKIKDTFGSEGIIGSLCWKVIQKGYSERCPFCPLPKLEKDPDTPVVWEERNTVTGRYYKNTDTVIEWTNGKKVHLQYAIDITDIRERQQETNQSLEVLKNILNGLDAYIYVSDMHTDEILFINNGMRDAFGLDDNAVGAICWQVLQQGFTERCSFCPNKQLADNPDRPVVWEEHNTVTRRHYKNVDSVIEWMDGKKVHMQHSTDITDILDAQGETLKARERLEIALTSSRAGVWEMIVDSDLLTYDPMCGRLFGFDPRRTSMSIEELIAHLKLTLRDASNPDIIQGLLNKDPYKNNQARDFHLIFPDGSERHVRNYGNTFRDENGRAIRLVGMCIDITQHVTMENEMKAAKEAAENASLAKSQFLSNMSHEIRTPMNAIIGMTELLLNEDVSERQRHYLHDIKISSTALLGIINDILDFSKIEAGKLQLVPVDYDFMAMLENLESMFTFAAESKGIYFYLDIRDKLPACLHGDDIRLRQALVNVIGNAVKFTREGGVTLSVGIDGDLLNFNVADTGIGIKEEDIPSIFKDFGQLDMRNNRNIAGTGLGLSITKSLISLMDGSIEVESEYGVGTVFHLWVPLVVGDEKKMVAKTRVFEFIEAPDANVLVVDDKEVNLNVASGLLGLAGITCDTATSGWEAVRMIEQKKYDIVFMDHMMPEMDGVETTKVLRESYDENELVVVALTANAVEGARESLLKARMNDYLSKPIDKMKLNQILVKWLPANKVRQRSGGAPPHAKTGNELSPLLKLVEQVEGVNVTLGLERISWMQDVYEKSLEIFMNRLSETIERLDAFLADGDVKGFTIEVHGVKGSLGNIGATEMAAKAEALEMKSKENDLEFCRGNLPELLTELSTLREALIDAFAAADVGTKVIRPRGDPEALRSRLAAMRELVDTFEGDAALDLLRELAGFDYGEELNAELEKLRGLLDAFNYEQALTIIDDLT